MSHSHSNENISDDDIDTNDPEWPGLTQAIKASRREARQVLDPPARSSRRDSERPALFRNTNERHENGLGSNSPADVFDEEPFFEPLWAPPLTAVDDTAAPTYSRPQSHNEYILNMEDRGEASIPIRPRTIPTSSSSPPSSVRSRNSYTNPQDIGVGRRHQTMVMNQPTSTSPSYYTGARNSRSPYHPFPSMDSPPNMSPMTQRSINTPSPSQIPRAPRLSSTSLPVSPLYVPQDDDADSSWEIMESPGTWTPITHEDAAHPVPQNSILLGSNQPARRRRRLSTPRASGPHTVRRDLLTGQPFIVSHESSPSFDTTPDTPEGWRSSFAAMLVGESFCGQHLESRMTPMRFQAMKWTGRMREFEPLRAGPPGIESLLVASCAQSGCNNKRHCRGCWHGQSQQQGTPVPIGCLQSQGCRMRHVIAVFEALRAFDEHYMRFCSSSVEPMAIQHQRPVSTTKPGQYLNLQLNLQMNQSEGGLAVFAETLRIIEYYLVYCATTAHEEEVQPEQMYKRLIEFSFLPRMIEEIFSAPYMRLDVWMQYAELYTLVLRFLHGYTEAYPTYLFEHRWAFSYSCGIGPYMYDEGEITWLSSGRPTQPPFYDLVRPAYGLISQMQTSAFFEQLHLFYIQIQSLMNG